MLEENFQENKVETTNVVILANITASVDQSFNAEDTGLVTDLEPGRSRNPDLFDCGGPEPVPYKCPKQNLVMENSLGHQGVEPIGLVEDLGLFIFSTNESTAGSSNSGLLGSGQMNVANKVGETRLKPKLERNRKKRSAAITVVKDGRQKSIKKEFISETIRNVESVLGGQEIKDGSVSGAAESVTCTEGSSTSSQRLHSWTILRRLAGMSNLPWICIGDFNEILWDFEKLGGIRKNWRQICDFREVLEDCSLEDMGFIGPKFT
ncbi:hypothetical protein Dsin_015942 [Dipteronia sinensis]|uniref:Exo_endo_phos domain-containing protein n=1 Tax=Dipteronia sinensis TaxID=43782 RepID=A0AAE0E511_9ROSI|nr:hypothetical protein Dsin_015942 [Dipteronia sinensis]